MMLPFEEFHLEGQDGKEFIHIALDVLDAIFLPRPDLGRDIIIDRNVCPRFYIFGYLQVKTRIIHEDDTVGLPRRDVLLTHPHVLHDGGQMK